MRFTAELPLPHDRARAHSLQLTELIRDKIRSADANSISFAQYMDLALYTPTLGYYMNAFPKFGKEGDFTTAPETSTLFAQCLAKQIQQVAVLTGGDVLEFGSGSGKLMVDVLQA